MKINMAAPNIGAGCPRYRGGNLTGKTNSWGALPQSVALNRRLAPSWCPDHWAPSKNLPSRALGAVGVASALRLTIGAGREPS